MKDIKEKVSIVMPAYNEADHIVYGVQETIKTFEEFGCPWELIVIDDGSTDATYGLLQGLAKRYPDKLVVKRNTMNTGKGAAIRKAVHFITGEYVVFLDADMDLHPLQVQALFDIMRLNNSDIVIGSKLHPNSVVKYPLARKVMSFIYYILIRVLFDLPCHDTQTGLKLFKAEVARQIFPLILVKKFAFDLEVLANAHRRGYTIAEAPIVLSPQRRFGRVGLDACVSTFIDTLAVFYRMNIVHYYDRIDYYRRKNLGKELKRVRR